jgi:hypothetical protein
VANGIKGRVADSNWLTELDMDCKTKLGAEWMAKFVKTDKLNWKQSDLIGCGLVN